MLERHVKAALKKRLTELGAYYFMPVQRGLGTVSIDFVICYQGRFIGIEAKRPGGVLRPLQKITIEGMRAAGARVFVIDNVDDAANLVLD